MAEGIVDRLELVEIEQDQPHRPPLGQHPARFGEEETAIEQAGQFVARGQSVKIAHRFVEPALARNDAPRRGQLRGDLEIGGRFAEEIIEAVLQRADLRFQLLAPGEHHGEGVARARRVAQRVDDLEAVGARHLAIDDRDVERFAALDQRDRLAAVAAGHNAEAEPPRHVTDPRQVILVIIRDKGTIVRLIWFAVTAASSGCHKGHGNSWLSACEI